MFVRSFVVSRLFLQRSSRRLSLLLVLLIVCSMTSSCRIGRQLFGISSEHTSVSEGEVFPPSKQATLKRQSAAKQASKKAKFAASIEAKKSIKPLKNMRLGPESFRTASETKSATLSSADRGDSGVVVDSSDGAANAEQKVTNINQAVIDKNSVQGYDVESALDELVREVANERLARERSEKQLVSKRKEQTPRARLSGMFEPGAKEVPVKPAVQIDNNKIFGAVNAPKSLQAASAPLPAKVEVSVDVGDALPQSERSEKNISPQSKGGLPFWQDIRPSYERALKWASSHPRRNLFVVAGMLFLIILLLLFLLRSGTRGV